MTTLKLDPESLEVTSFETMDEAGGTAPEGLLPPTPGCSAVDACPTRPC